MRLRTAHWQAPYKALPPKVQAKFRRSEAGWAFGDSALFGAGFTSTHSRGGAARPAAGDAVPSMPPRLDGLASKAIAIAETHHKRN